jgi:hypothetical protein
VGAGAILVLAVTAAIAVILGGGTPAFADFPAAKIVSQTSGRCLDVDAGTAGNARTNVQLYNCRAFSGDPLVGYQIFDQRTVFPGTSRPDFKLVNAQTGKCLTYNVGGHDDSAVWAENCDRSGQGWWRVETDRGTMFVAIETANECLDAVDFDGGNATGIDLFSCAAQGPWNTWTVF